MRAQEPGQGAGGEQGGPCLCNVRCSTGAERGEPVPRHCTAARRAPECGVGAGVEAGAGGFSASLEERRLPGPSGAQLLSLGRSLLALLQLSQLLVTQWSRDEARLLPPRGREAGKQQWRPMGAQTERSWLMPGSVQAACAREAGALVRAVHPMRQGWGVLLLLAPLSALQLARAIGLLL